MTFAHVVITWEANTNRHFSRLPDLLFSLTLLIKQSIHVLIIIFDCYFHQFYHHMYHHQHYHHYYPHSYHSMLITVVMFEYHSSYNCHYNHIIIYTIELHKWKPVNVVVLIINYICNSLWLNIYIYIFLQIKNMQKRNVKDKDSHKTFILPLPCKYPFGSCLL